MPLPIKQSVRPDTIGDKRDDLTQTLKGIESRLAALELLAAGQMPSVRVLTSDGVWLPSDRVILIDSAARNVTYVLPTLANALAQGFAFLRVKWVASANTAAVTTIEKIDGATNYTFATPFDAIDIIPSVVGGYASWYKF